MNDLQLVDSQPVRLDTRIQRFPRQQFIPSNAGKDLHNGHKLGPGKQMEISPHTQTVEALHRVAVPQQVAAILAEPLQQPLCGLAADPAEVEGRLHASPRLSEASLC